PFDEVPEVRLDGSKLVGLWQSDKQKPLPLQLVVEATVNGKEVRTERTILLSPPTDSKQQQDSEQLLKQLQQCLEPSKTDTSDVHSGDPKGNASDGKEKNKPLAFGYNIATDVACTDPQVCQLTAAVLDRQVHTVSLFAQKVDPFSNLFDDTQRSY